MKVSGFVICVILSFCVTTSYAQELNRSKEGYTLKGVEYKTEAEIIDLLQGQPIALKLYQDAQRDLRIADNFGVVSMIFIGATGLLYFKVVNTIENSPNYLYLTLGSVSLGLACLTGTTGIVFLDKSNKNKERVIDHFNSGSLSLRPETYDFELKLRLVNNGLGLLLNF